MKFNLLKASAIAIFAISPVAAQADAIAAALSASFGTRSFGFGPTILRPQSVSVAAAVGQTAVAGAAANAGNSSAVAGASDTADFTPTLDVKRGTRGVYETSVAFAPTEGSGLATLVSDLLIRVANLEGGYFDHEARIAALEDKVEAICATHPVGPITATTDAIANVSLDWQGLHFNAGTVTVSDTTVTITCN